jgi:serine/threonine-protein kinase
MSLSAALADRYRVERELGQGGMATVYLAHDLRHDRKVALKVLRPELSAILGAERFLTEIKTTANLQHPHILSLFDSGEANGLVFYVMPFVDGESLRDRLRREHQLPVEDAVRIASEVADALEYAHGHGVIHRDIKPENILLHGGHALVADFGIALAASKSDGGTRMTETGLSLGTPHYMAPEQAMGEREITAKADIYALGCVLYEMLTAEPPFVGATAQAIIARVMTEEPRSLTLQRKTIPPHVEAAVTRALEKLPADRFASAAQFAAALSGQAPVGRVTRAAPAAPTPGGTRRLATAAPWAVAAAALAVAAWATLKPEPTVPVERFGIAVSDSFAIRTDHQNHSLALSPDGRRFAYTGTGPRGSRVLYLRETDQLTPRLVAGTEGAEEPFFSPDGAWIGYFTSSKLMKVAVEGGPPLTIADASGTRGGAWGDDDRIVFGLGTSGLMSVAASGGPVDTLLTLEADSASTSFRRPSILPGSKAVVFTALRGEGTSIGAVDLASRRITWLQDQAFDARFVPTGHLVYATGGGALIAVPFDAGALRVTGSPVSLLEGLLVKPNNASGEFAVSNAGRLLYLGGGALPQSLVSVDPDGTERTLAEAVNLLGPRFSPDGRRVVLSASEGAATDIHVIDLAAGTMSRLTFGGTNQYPEWTPDGRRIAFSTIRPGSNASDLYWTPSDGSGEAAVLLSAPGAQFESQFTPDGRTLVYRTSHATNTRDLFLAPVDSPAAGRPWVGVTPFSERAPALSPDGRWLAYASDESGRDEIYVRAFPSPAGRWQVSAAGGLDPRWAPDGRGLYYRTADSLISVAVATEPTFAIGQRSTVLVRRYFADINHAHWDVSPDGREFLFVRTSGEVITPVLALNWFEELRRRVPR